MNKQFIRQSLLLAGKDLHIFFKDKGSLLFALLFPFIFVIIFSLVMGDNVTGSDEPMTVYIASAEEENGLSQMIIDSIASENNGIIIAEANPDEAFTALGEEQINGYLFFPGDFTDKVYAGDNTGLTVYYNPEAASTRAALTAIARSISASLTSRQVIYKTFSDLAAAELPPEQLAAIIGGQTSGNGSTPETLPEVALIYEKAGDIEPAGATDVLIPGYLTMFVFFALALTGETLIGEKENFTLGRLVAGGADKKSIIAGKYLAAFGKGMIQVAAFWIAGILIFNVNMGRHPLTVVLISVLLVLSASGIGVFIASLAKSKKGAGSIGVFVSLSAAAFGGSMWPLFIMPRWLQTAAKITPHAWANSAFNKLMLFGAAPSDVVPEMIALVTFSLIFMSLGICKFKLE